ncbi:MAG: VCBS repeat-containing protein [Magnetococcales bacterium]|nr:VCBS repeat-containing protein [Magnetococcales bacterium]
MATYSISFAPAVNHAVGGPPVAIASTDVNGDGNIDLVAGLSGGTASLLPGDGRGGFAPASDYTGHWPQSINRADFDGDGSIDLVNVSFSDDRVLLLFGDGTGHFAPAIHYTVGDGPIAVTTADFNGDGKIDIACANFLNNNISLLLNNTPPAAPTGLDLDAADDLGGSNSDNITRQTSSLTIMGSSGVVGANIVLFDDQDNDGLIDSGEALVTTDVTAADWSVDINLTAGTHAIRAIQVDAMGSSSRASQPMTIMIPTTNRAPTVSGLSRSMDEDNYSPLDLTFADFKAQFNDSDGDELSSIKITRLPSYGALRWYNGDAITAITLNQEIAISGIEYVPHANWHGHDNFSWSGSDGQLDATHSATVDITVKPVGDTPALTNFSKTGPRNRAIPFTGHDFIGQFSDVDGDSLARIRITQLPDSGSLTLAGVAVTINQEVAGSHIGDLVFTPVAEWEGLVSWRWQGFDGVNWSHDATIYLAVGTYTKPVLFEPFFITSYVTGSPQAVVGADFNNDGKADIACANTGSDGVSLLFGDGLGGLTIVRHYAVGIRPRSIISADFNNDGKADIACANAGSDDVSVLLGDGQGGLTNAHNYATGSLPYSVGSSDFNGDGKADLICANGDDSNISVLLGDGQGGFSDASNYAVGVSPRSVTVADFNGDNKADIVCANATSDDISILLGNGQGGFANASSYAIGGTPFSVTSADFNSDGKADIVCTSSYKDEVLLLLGDGQGGFAVPRGYAVGDFPGSVISADFNSDGRADVFCVNEGSDDGALLLGDGQGGFAVIHRYVVGDWPQSASSADFNSDGLTDIVVATNQRSEEISLLLSGALDLDTDSDSGPSDHDNITHRTSGLTLRGVGTSGTTLVLFDDRNHSNRVDIGEVLATNHVTGTVWQSDVSLAPGTHAIRFIETDGSSNHVPSSMLMVTVDTTITTPTDLDLADESDDGFANSDNITSHRVVTISGSGGEVGATLLLFDNRNSNNIPDFREYLTTIQLATTSWTTSIDLTPNTNHEIRAIQTDTAGNRSEVSLPLMIVSVSSIPANFAATRDYAVGSYPVSVTSADFNSDGKIDIACVNAGEDEVSLLLGDGQGGFSDARSYSVDEWPISITSADLNGDGKTDIVCANEDDGNVSLLLGDGQGGFADVVSYDVGSLPQSVISADFNGDGKMDIACADSGDYGVSVLLGDGQGGLADAIDFVVGHKPLSITSADFNGDGKIDIACANANSDNVSLLFGDGQGGFSAIRNYAVGDAPVSITVADFNIDGKTDIVCANASSNSVSLLLGDGQGGFIPARNYAVGRSPQSVISVDFNGDGSSDIVCSNLDDDNVSLLLGDGQGGFADAHNYITGSGAYSVASADFNGDGTNDIVCANGYDDNVSVLLGVPLHLVADDDGGSFNDDNITRQTRGLTFRGRINHSDKSVTLFDDINGNDSVDEGEVWATTAVVNGEWAVDVSLSAGPHAVKSVSAGAVSPPLALLVDTVAPEVTIPLADTTVSQLSPTLTGSIADDSACTLALRVFDQTSQCYLVRQNGQWRVSTADHAWTSVVATDTADWQNWSIKADEAWAYNHVYQLTTRAVDRAGNERVQQFNLGYGEKIATRIELAQSLYAINPEQSITLQGQLLRQDGKVWGRDLSGQSVRMQVTAPDGEVTTVATTADIDGRFRFADLTGLSQKGNYKLQVSTEDDLIVGGASSFADVRVGPPVGYVILVQGLLQTGSGAPEGLLAHKRSTNRIYQTLLRRGFTADNIRYLNADTAALGPNPDAGKIADYRNLLGVPAGSMFNTDFLPTRDNIRAAIETWAYDKMTGAAAPLYLVMVDHGSPETLYIGKDNSDGRVTSTDLANWLNRLDSKLASTAVGNAGKLALKEDQTVILGSCYSGSFMDDLSRDEVNNKNRMVITSATAKEKSYRGATESDGIQDGELFLQHLFQALGRGKTFYEAFTDATRLTENTPGIANNVSNAKDNTKQERMISKINDNSGQHPLLEDNGDKIGSNALSTQSSQDGAVAKDRVLGMTLASLSNSLEHQAQVAAVAPTVYDIGTATTTLLWARDNSLTATPNAGAAWVTMMGPGTQQASSSGNFQISLDLPTGSLNYNAEQRRWEIDSKAISGFTGFTLPGRYQLQYTVRDTETGEVSTPVMGNVYKGKSGNRAPGTITLQAPSATGQVSRIGLFNWSDAIDPDGDAVSYNLVVTSDQASSTVVYRQENLELSQALVDFKGLLEQGNYWWQVEAVDFYGKLTTSANRAFSLTFQNDIPAVLQGVVYSNQDYSAITGATIKLNGQVISSSESNGSLAALIAASSGTLTIEKAGYQTKTVPLDKVDKGSVNQMVFGLDGGTASVGVRYKLNGGKETTAASVVGTSKTDTVTLLSDGKVTIKAVESVVGSGGTDTITLATAGTVVVVDVETVIGSGGADTIILSSSNTTPVILIGGGGADKLTGSGGARTTFRYTSAAETSPTVKDTVTNFAANLDVIEILASLRKGSWSDSSAFIGSTTFNGKGACQIRFDDKSKLLQIDLDGKGDKKAEMALTLTGVKLADLQANRGWLSWSG